jgi:hypothetical protein
VRINRLPYLWIGTLSAFAVLSVLAAVRAADWSYGADTGTFVQIILDAFGGMRNGVEHGTHYRFHWSPSLVLLWPFLAATHSLWVLQTILAAATVASAPLLAAIARARGIAGGVADRIGAVALVYPPLVAVGFGEFRDLGLLPVLALGWWLAVQRRSWWWVAGLALLLAGLREDVCIELAIVGCIVAIDGALRHDRALVAAGLGSAALGVASDAIYALVVVPRVGPWPPSHFYVYPFASGPAALLLAPLLHPLAFGAAILTLGRLTYVLEAFVPLAFVPLAGVRDRAARQQRLGLADGDALRRALDPVAADRVRRRDSVAETSAPVDDDRLRSVGDRPDRLQPTAPAALPATVVPRARQRAYGPRPGPAGGDPGDPRRVVHGALGAAPERGGARLAARRSRRVHRLRDRLSEPELPTDRAAAAARSAGMRRLSAGGAARRRRRVPALDRNAAHTSRVEPDVSLIPEENR